MNACSYAVVPWHCQQMYAICVGRVKRVSNLHVCPCDADADASSASVFTQTQRVHTYFYVCECVRVTIETFVMKVQKSSGSGNVTRLCRKKLHAI